ncbi:hypothetical protein VB715_16395 [Crocosphaera sp. UHCC 0190]|uniref:sunset domain-containing protein n=1 Tax=Crocosphaera sp. UHCC 0190 TaxID=3110246 RepID=UPI002B20A3A2|nr:hypothetical protein [Crocosphaera sp. UHCC 0190]MEA5511355.1 hypothetical protein [Crocosphaera sp. UHCC 0190]
MKKIIGFVAVSLVTFSSITIQSQNNAAFASSSTIPPNPKCNIKGNISVSTGKKLYHIPGQQDYEKTVISTDKGERWFCSEEEARKAGWTKAPR